VSFLHSLPMQLCALETHIRISRNLKKLVDLVRNHRFGPGLHALFRPKQAAQKTQKISLWVAMALRDSCKWGCATRPGRAKFHAWGVQFNVFWAWHALHAQNFRGVIGACLKKKYIISKALLVRQSTEYSSVQFRATFVTFSGRGVLLLRRASTNKVLDAMRRGDNFSVVCPQARCSTP